MAGVFDVQRKFDQQSLAVILQHSPVMIRRQARTEQAQHGQAIRHTPSVVEGSSLRPAATGAGRSHGY